MLIGYARCSTDTQDLTAQQDGLTALGVKANRIYVDHGLTGRNRDRPGLRDALAACRSGDTLVVTKLDRLARSLPDARDIVEELTAGEVKLNIGGSLHDPNDPIGRLLFNVLAMIAEFESDLIRMRTREGMKVAKAKRPTAGQATQAQPHPGDSSGRAVPSRTAHHRRASRTVLRRPIDGLSRCPTRRRTWCRPLNGERWRQLTKDDSYSGGSLTKIPSRLVTTPSLSQALNGAQRCEAKWLTVVASSTSSGPTATSSATTVSGLSSTPSSSPTCCS